jgi:spermidine synthase
MLGSLGALLHPDPQECMVIGLGTGESAGWLANLPDVRQVDVVELEPALVAMAEKCEQGNRDALQNSKVNLIFNDAREQLTTTPKTYDLIVSEPSNPYRAGIANLYTREFYQSVVNRMKSDGVFVQWLQGYEIDQETVHLVISTLKSVFPNVEIWQSKHTDLLFVCSQQKLRYDPAMLAAKLAIPAYLEATSVAWRADNLAGVLARFVAGSTVTTTIAEENLAINTDDLNLIEFGLARSLGKQLGYSVQPLRQRAIDLKDDRPASISELDWDEVQSERWAMIALQEIAIPAESGDGRTGEADRLRFYESFLKRDFGQMVSTWSGQSRAARSPSELALLGWALAEMGDAQAASVADQLRITQPTTTRSIEADFIQAIMYFKQKQYKESATLLARAFRSLRHDPWALDALVQKALGQCTELVALDAELAQILLDSLETPFALRKVDERRMVVAALLASTISPGEATRWVEAFEPNIPWTEPFLKLRAAAYEASNHPLSADAARDYFDFVEDR